MERAVMPWIKAEYFSVCILLTLKITSSNILNSDSLFQLNWPGASIQGFSNNAEYVIMTTPTNEKYQCFLPDESRRHLNDINYPGPSAASLMQSVFTKEICTIRIETYWNFELCHGRFIRQYHEEKEAGKETKLLEFFLGKNMKSPGGKEYELQSVESFQGKLDAFKVPTITIDGKEVPYYEVLMDDGTPCDLRGNLPRLTRVRYVCEPGGRNELFTIKETSTCEYEAVILTSNLCGHPLYKPRVSPISPINCHSMNGAPVKPIGYEQLYKDTSSRTQFSPSKTKSTPKTSTTTGTQDKPTEAAAKQRLPRPILVDKQILKDFLNGDYCLHGGAGWWRYEFCYGKFAQQYHEDKSGRTVILLGSWNENAHKAWWTEQKKAVGAKSLTNLYGNGDICDITGKPRVTQVKLKCKEDMHPTAVTIYLTEPKDCEYILGVDSPIICSLLDTADEYGILHPVPIDNLSTKTTEKP